MQETEKKLSSKKRKQIFGILEVEKTEEDIEALDNVIII